MNSYPELASTIIDTPATDVVDAAVVFDPPQPTETEPEPASDEFLAPAPSLDLMSEAAFLTMWEKMHDMASGLLAMRIGSIAPLGDCARDEGGKMAGKACYSMILANPTLSEMLLSTKSTFWGQMALIGMHGFACVQVVRATIEGNQIQPQERKVSEHENA